MRLEDIRADLHVHTCLSPCADEAMTPAAIAREARRNGLGLIGICDHNSAENVAAARRAGAREGVTVVGGMEITTREEIHIMGFFEGDEDVMAMQDIVYAHLSGENDSERFGYQVVMDENDRAVALNERLLIGATDLPVEGVVDAIHGLGGVVIASHVNRGAFSITSQLGFIPPSLALDGVEVARAGGGAETGGDWLGLSVVTSSDAHSLQDIGRACSVLHVGAPSFGELSRALRGDDGRCVKA